MAFSPVNITLSGTTDATGKVTLIVHGLSPTRVSEWNAYATLSGSQAVMSVVIAGAPAGTAYGNLAQLGPVYCFNPLNASVTITNATANTAVIVQLAGYEADSSSELPPLSGPTPNSLLLGGPVSITGPVAITGPVTVDQFDPSQLLVGQVGPPIVENLSTPVGAGSSAYVFGNPTPVSIAGYAALLLHLSQSGGGGLCWGQLIWYDGSGVVITQTDIGGLSSLTGQGFVGVVATISASVALRVFEPAGASTVVATVIPLVSAPANPDQLIDNLTGAATPFPDSRTLINTQTVVGAGLTVTTMANFVWTGKAVLSVVTTGTTFDCKVFSTDALGNVTQIVRIQNQPGALPQTIQLTSAPVSISFNNGGAGNLTPFISLTATS